MLELLINNDNLKKVKPPKMNIGEFWTFNEVENLFGIGQQAVHNSGSSMVDDTPSFAKSVVFFLNNHINYKSDSFKDIIENLDEKFLIHQSDNLIRFKNDKNYRFEVVNKIFFDTFDFRDNIDIEYLYIAIVLYLVKKYNYFNSVHPSHSLTKDLIKKYYASEKTLLKSYYDKLITEEEIKYLMDVCYGRYYFLEVHFIEKTNIRNVPKQIVRMFFEEGINLVMDKEFFEELEDDVEQSKIHILSGYTSDKSILQADNRNPEISGSSSNKNRYKTNAKLAKTIIEKQNYSCEYAKLIGAEHKTFKTKAGYYVEAHHLIPMSKQDNHLPTNIDRSENIVVLCPNCHRAIHNGIDEEKVLRLEVLYNNRKDKFKDVGIDIDFDKIKNYYKIKNKK